MPAINDLLDDADDKFCGSIVTNSEHILHYDMPERDSPSYYHHLSPRKRSKELIPQRQRV